MVALKVVSAKNIDLILARFLERLFDLFLKGSKVCHVALAGGQTPMEVYGLLSKKNLKWDRLRFYLSDERYVPLDSELSNYRNVSSSLGRRAKITFFKTDMDIYECGVDYSLQLPERLHIALLGVGRDGHTASLFAGVECEKVSPKVCISLAPDGTRRLSLTEEYLNTSCIVIFFLKGEEKAQVLKELLQGKEMPASKISGAIKTYIFTNISP
ncbi:MAG: 6-phosphogluconolactonase [Aquificota bacterium]|nr:MAG: 6-phosphogluconolactonase [Aquificota bacterium]